jgi:CheY-like chemotaxis protein
VESEEGRDSTFNFTVRLPVAPFEEGDESSVPTQEAIVNDDGDSEDLRLRVLLAEDNVVNQKVAVRMSERLGHRTDVVANGYEVLDALSICPYDVVLMDVRMPEMDGLEATRTIRARSAGRDPHIIALTASAMQEDRERCLQAGMDAFLGKPIRSEDLRQALETYLARRPRGATVESAVR